MTTATEPVDRAVIAAQVVGTVEHLLRRGLIHPTKQIELARLVHDYNRALDGDPSPEAVAREQGRATS
jgi:hypothetical protein